MTQPADVVTLRVNGRNFAGWQGVAITRSIEQAASSFTLQATPRYPGEPNPIRIVPGDAKCAVFIGGEKVITGWIDSLAPTLDATAAKLTVAGRSLTCDVVDCSAEHKPGRWHGVKAEQIARELVKPFGIEVAVLCDTGAPIARHAVERAESVFECLDRLARMRGLLVTDDQFGRLVLTRTVYQRAETGIVEGGNLLGGSSKFDASAVFSKYTVHGQTAGNDEDFGDTVAQITGEAVDPGVKRYRPLVIQAENHCNAATAKARAQWEAATRLGKSTEATVHVLGWRQVPGGPLWAPGLTVHVKSADLGLDGDFLITDVTFTLNEQGTRTTLALALPDAYKTEPVKVKSRGAGAAWIVGKVTAIDTAPKKGAP